MIRFLTKMINETMHPQTSHVTQLVPELGMYSKNFNRALHDAVMRDDPEGIRKAVTEGKADVEQWSSPAGMPELQWASMAGCPKAIHTLCDLGAEVDKQNSLGGRALFNAIHYGQTACVEALLQRGANLHIQQSMPWWLRYLVPAYHLHTPLHFACGVNASPEIVKLLLKFEADPWQENFKKETPWAQINMETAVGREIDRIMREQQKRKIRKLREGKGLPGKPGMQHSTKSNEAMTMTLTFSSRPSKKRGKLKHRTPAPDFT